MTVDLDFSDFFVDVTDSLVWYDLVEMLRFYYRGLVPYPYDSRGIRLIWYLLSSKSVLVFVELGLCYDVSVYKC